MLNNNIVMDTDLENKQSFGIKKMVSHFLDTINRKYVKIDVNL